LVATHFWLLSIGWPKSLFGHLQLPRINLDEKLWKNSTWFFFKFNHWQPKKFSHRARIRKFQMVTNTHFQSPSNKSWSLDGDQNFLVANDLFWERGHVICFEIFFVKFYVATPLWAKCEGEAHTPKSGNLESSGTPENSELKLKGQNTSHWGVLGVIEKVLKCRCLNWPHIGHLYIYSPSYGQKKGRESNWQFDSRPLKVKNRPLPDVRWQCETWRWKALEESYNIGSDLAPIGLGSLEIWASKVLGLQRGQFQDSFGTPTWESREKEPFGCSLGGEL
jgi:hypothetical protein